MQFDYLSISCARLASWFFYDNWHEAGVEVNSFIASTGNNKPEKNEIASGDTAARVLST